MSSLALSSLFYVTVNTNEKKDTEKLFLAVNFSQCLQLGTDVRGVLHQKKALELQNALIKVRRSILDCNFAILAIKNYSLPGKSTLFYCLQLWTHWGSCFVTAC